MMEKKKTIKKVSDISYLNFDQFLKIEDEELKRYLYARGSYSQKSETRVYENDQKIGFYNTSKQIKRNTSGKFYIKDTLHEWIVYEKSSGKIKMSSSTNAHIKEFFMNYYFKSNYTISIFFPDWRITKSFIKRVIEDKINTTEDVLKYIRSYIIKNKNISLDTVYELCIHGIKHFSIINLFIDPENLLFDKSFFQNYVCIKDLSNKGYFQIKVSDIPNIDKMIKDYEERQIEKFIDVS